MWHQLPSITRLREPAQVTRLADVSLALSAIDCFGGGTNSPSVGNTGSYSSAHPISPAAIDLSPHMTINIFVIYIVCVNEGCI